MSGEEASLRGGVAGWCSVGSAPVTEPPHAADTVKTASEEDKTSDDAEWRRVTVGSNVPEKVLIRAVGLGVGEGRVRSGDGGGSSAAISTINAVSIGFSASIRPGHR